MTEMTEAQKVIAKVADEHTHSIDFDFCYCGVNFFAGDGITGHGAEAWSNHLAAEIDKALGGLTQEWTVSGDCSISPSRDCDHYGDHGPWTCAATAETREEAEKWPVTNSPGAHIESRWVSGWSEAQS